jgi:RNA polymerase sigma-70 factor (ECF subfamily)
MWEIRMGTLALVMEASETDFDEFFRREYARLLSTMFLACGDRAEAEDLAQAAMVRALERWETVSSAASPAAYVYRIAFNANRSRMRRIAAALRRRSHQTEYRDPAEVAVQRADTLRALRSLSTADREAVLLVEWLQMSSEEAAAVLGIAASAVRGRLHRARAALRTLLGDDDD